MYPESKDIDISEKTVQEYNTWYQISRDEPKFFDRPGYKATCKVPFSGDPGLFELQPNPHTMGARASRTYWKAFMALSTSMPFESGALSRGNGIARYRTLRMNA